MLLERADFADPAILAAHRQACWERQREHVRIASPLLHRVWAGRDPPLRLEALAELPLVDKEMLRASQNAAPPFGGGCRSRPSGNGSASPAHRDSL